MINFEKCFAVTGSVNVLIRRYLYFVCMSPPNMLISTSVCAHIRVSHTTTKNINCRSVSHYKGHLNTFGNSVTGYLNVSNNRNSFDKKGGGGQCTVPIVLLQFFISNSFHKNVQKLDAKKISSN